MKRLYEIARKFWRFLGSSSDVAFTVRVNNEYFEKYRAYMNMAGHSDLKTLLNEALAVYFWCLNKVNEGESIGSFGENGVISREVICSGFENIRGNGVQNSNPKQWVNHQGVTYLRAEYVPKGADNKEDLAKL